MFIHCLHLLRREQRLWSPWKLWPTNSGCLLPEHMTRCLWRGSWTQEAVKAGGGNLHSINMFAL